MMVPHTVASRNTKCGSPKLSVTIVAQNEARTIRRVLAAMESIADEIIFLDSGSTDGTIEIAQSFGVVFRHQPWLGYADQKNLAIDLASGDWILSLDADEILTPQLVAEISSVLKGAIPENISGFKIPRVLYIGDTPVKHGGFYPDAQLRLFRKGRGRFAQRIVHEAVRVDGKVVQLRNNMLHYAYPDIERFAEAMDQYALLSARHYAEAGDHKWRASLINEIIHPGWTLFYRHFIRQGFRGGELCWKLNLIYADYVRKKIRYLRQLLSQSSL